jgi:hypothetical protein
MKIRPHLTRQIRMVSFNKRPPLKGAAKEGGFAGARRGWSLGSAGARRGDEPGTTLPDSQIQFE